MEPRTQDDDPLDRLLPAPGRKAWRWLQKTWAFRTWGVLQDLGFVRSSLEFAGLFLLSFVPFLLLVSSALGSDLPRAFATRGNFSSAATHDVTSLFARSGGGSAQLSVLSALLIVLSADAVAHRLQTWCIAVYRTTSDPMRAWGRRALWLCGVLGFLAAQIAIGRHLGHLNVAAAALELLALILFWWWSLHLLIGGIGWRRLLPGGVAIALLYEIVGVGTSVFGSGSIISGARAYGPIGTVMTLMEVIVALGLAIHLGVYLGSLYVPRSNSAQHHPDLTLGGAGA